MSSVAHEEVEHHASRKASLVTFLVLVALTVLEVLLAMTRIKGSIDYDPGISGDAVFRGLVLLAAANGFLVLFYFMNLRFESKTMKLMVAIPLAFPVLYALVLIAEAIWRRTW